MEFLTEKTFAEGIKKIEKQLEAVKTEGYIPSFDGIKLHYEFFKTENAKATVVAVHGLSEFTKKYYEFTYAMTESGFNVMLYDQRCHGLSERLTDDVRLIHVDDFSDYVKDLEHIIEKTKALSEKPIYLYAHSMGGAVTAFYLEKHGGIEKAVLASPMFLPVASGLPPFLARILLRFCELRVGKSTRFRYTKDFNPNHQFKNTSDASYARFCHNMDMRRSDERYQSTPLTVGWTLRSLCLAPSLMRAAKRITTPILLLSPENDTVVKIKPQYRFARLCKSCTIQNVKNAKHSMLTGDDETVKSHLLQIIDYFSSPSA